MNTGHDENTPRSKVADRIIRSRGHMPTGPRVDGGNDALDYHAALITEGFPQMGFSVFCNNGQRHGFFYHNLENLELNDREHGTYLRFTHRGKAATLRGDNLHEMFQAIMEHTLQAIYEYSAEVYPALAGSDPIITRIRIDDTTPKPPRPEGGERDGGY